MKAKKITAVVMLIALTTTAAMAFEKGRANSKEMQKMRMEMRMMPRNKHFDPRMAHHFDPRMAPQFGPEMRIQGRPHMLKPCHGPQGQFGFRPEFRPEGKPECKREFREGGPDCKKQDAPKSQKHAEKKQAPRK